MKTNKEIVTEIIEDLDLKYYKNPKVKVTRNKLIECWSEYRKDPDYKFYGYACSKSLSNVYKKLFINIKGKSSAEHWGSYILLINGYKYCFKCKNLHILDKFPKNKITVSGYSNECTLCKKLRSKLYYKDNKVKIKVKNKLYREDNKEKLKNYNKEYREDNKEKLKNYNKEYYINNKEKIAIHNHVYYEENKDKVSLQRKVYYKNNRELFYVHNAKRRAAKLNRTPSWSSEDDQLKIKDLYTQAKSLEKLHGVKYHVDHIIPLQGELVSGLHILSNLQVITAEENLSKGNTYNTG